MKLDVTYCWNCQCGAEILMIVRCCDPDSILKSAQCPNCGADNYNNDDNDNYDSVIVMVIGYCCELCSRGFS